MQKTDFDNEDMVECHFRGAVYHIPDKVFFSVLARSQVDGKKFVRYKEGARLYSMSEREFYNLAHEANAVYKRNKMALIKLDDIDRFLEYFRF